MKKKNYKTNYNEFWKDLVEKDGVLNKDQVMRELSDYSFMLDQVPTVYCEITGWRISKPNTYAYEVLNEFHTRYLDKDCTQDDISEMIKSAKTKEDLIVELKSYFELQ